MLFRFYITENAARHFYNLGITNICTKYVLSVHVILGW